MNLLKKANQHFLAGDYKKALRLYEDVQNLYGEKLVSVNIDLCRKRIFNKIESIEYKNKEAKILLKNDLKEILEKKFGIEKFYIINLSRRKDRFLRAMREMIYQGLECERIDGVDAKFSREVKKLHLEFTTRKNNKEKITSSHISEERFENYKEWSTTGVFGYLLSQKKIFEDAIRNGYKKILIFDDDIFFSSNCCEILKNVAEKLPENYKILLLGSSEYSDRNSKEFKSRFLIGSESIYQPIPDHTCGSFAVVYDQSIYQDILLAINEGNGPYDNAALGFLYHKYQNDCFAITPSVCIPDVGDSDIRTSERVQEVHSERMHWEFSRYKDFISPYRICIFINSFLPLAAISKIRNEIATGVYLNIYYKSNDGLRSIIIGNEFNSLDKYPQKIDSNGLDDLNELFQNYNLPNFDMAILWPDDYEITSESVLSNVVTILQHVNEKKLKAGDLNGFIYFITNEYKIVKGKHSVIIPCYRNVHEVTATIQSALLQDAVNFEVIVVNDNPLNEEFSKKLYNSLLDWTISINKNYLLDNLKILDHKVRRNASSARNTGFLVSNGEWISFLDDDDYYEKNRLSLIEDVLKNTDEKVGACYCGYTGSWNGKINMSRFPSGNLSDHVILLKYAEHYMCTNTVTFKRKAFEQIGGFDESFERHQDLELMVRFFQYYEIIAIKEFLVVNRPSKVTSTFDANLISLSKVKTKFLKYIRNTIIHRDEKFKELVIDAHLNDIFKLQKDHKIDVKKIIKSVFAEILK